MTAPLPRLAELRDFRVWPGVIVGDGQEASAEFVLDAASAYVRLEAGNAELWPDPDAIPVAIKSVVVQVAARAWRNPDCAAMVTTGPFSEQFAQGVVDVVYLTDVDKAVIAKVAGRRVGIWTMPTTRGDDFPNDVSPGYRDRFTGDVVPGSVRPGDAYLLGGDSWAASWLAGQ
jgi:hypothetical protein